uniref:hypothetical protein n=1 Tax=Lentinus flexipes TaxID=3163629 RepID=UPI002264B8AB|nr:hypothetical protein OSR58_mgp53 [Ganoderma flexipes]UYX56908.1 hypothetical protein [Ganoderma flexipes]
MILTFLNKLFSNYCKIVRNHTGFYSNNYKFILFLLLLGLASFFFRIEIINNFSNNKMLQYVLLYGSIFNMLFIKLNLGCRVVITIMKGLPYFIKEIKIGKVKNIKLYFMVFLIYNMILIFLSIIVLFRLYSVLSTCYSEIYKMVFIYNTIFSFSLCAIYLEEKYSYVTFSMDEVNIHNLNLIQKLLLLSLPAIIFLNLSTYVSYGTQFLNYLKSSNTIYCEGGDGNPNSPQRGPEDVKTNQKSKLQPFPNANIKNNKQINHQLIQFSEEGLKFSSRLYYHKNTLYEHNYNYFKYNHTIYCEFIGDSNSNVTNNVQSNNQGSLPFGSNKNCNGTGNSKTQINSKTNNQLY